jgi:hypothetical protein
VSRPPLRIDVTKKDQRELERMLNGFAIAVLSHFVQKQLEGGQRDFPERPSSKDEGS